MREVSTKEGEKHQQLEKAVQDAEIRAQREHRSWHREHQRCEKLQEELKISSTEAAEAAESVAKVRMDFLEHGDLNTMYVHIHGEMWGLCNIKPDIIIT